MKILRILGILILLAGIASLLFSNYITSQVEEGNAQIKEGEKKVAQGNQLFSLNPITQELGKGATNSANKKIATGKEQIAYYTEMAELLQTWGIVGIVVGAGVFLVSFTGKGKKKR